MVGKNLIKVIKKNIFMIVAGFIDFETSSMILLKDEVNKDFTCFKVPKFNPLQFLPDLS